MSLAAKSSLPPWLRSTREGLLLDVVVVPRARQSEVVGALGGRLKIRLKAPPVDGAANRELLVFLASLLSVPRSDLTLVRGSSSRRKTVLILEPSARLIERLRTASIERGLRG